MTILHITTFITQGHVKVIGKAFAIGPRHDWEDEMAKTISEMFTTELQKLTPPEGVSVMIHQDFPKDGNGNTVKPIATVKLKRKKKRTRE
jgi:hypothetical protein